MAKPNDKLSELNGIEIKTPIITTDQTIEAVVNGEFDSAVAQEAFMNERVEIIVASTTDENAPPHFILDVNNIKQPIFRDVPMTVRRMFVEVLARCKETKYTQHRDPIELDRQEMRARTAFVYPFQVLHDPSGAKGHAWLAAVKAEAA